MKNFILSIVLSISIFSGSVIAGESPYELSWERDGVISAVGGAMVIGAYFSDNSVKAFTPEDLINLHRDDINIFDRGAAYNYNKNIAKVSDYFLTAAEAAPLIFLIDDNMRSDFGKIAAMYVETIAITSGAVGIAKGNVQRARPFTYNPDAPIDEKLKVDARKSFFSGHTGLTFASAVFVAKVYSDYYPESNYKAWVWGGAIGTATAVGLMRYFAGKHFPSDILTGAIVGSAVGYLIPELHKKDNKDLSVDIQQNSSTCLIGFSYRF